MNRVRGEAAAPARPPSPEDIKRFRRNLRDEVDGEALYRSMAEAERDPHLKLVYERLAESERRHRHLWEEKLREAGEPIPSYRPSLRVRVLGWLARHFGTNLVAPIVAEMEVAAYSMYDDQPEAVAHGLPADERSHARVFREIARQGVRRTSAIDIARIEGRHGAATGNALRAAVLGANDGLVSNLSLVMGVAGASPGPEIVLLSGIAGLLAGSLSMALGEWISVRSGAELIERQVRIELDEIRHLPDEEIEELTLIYMSRGIPEEEARATARRIIADQKAALETLSREELGISPDDHGQNPWVAAAASFLTFSVGAAFPVVPWLFLSGFAGVAGSVVASTLGLMLTGAITSVFTGRDVWFSAARMVAFGLSAAGITFGIGRGIGVSTGIS